MQKLILLVGLLFSILSTSATEIEEHIDVLFQNCYESISSKEWNQVDSLANISHELSSNRNYSWGIANSVFIKGWSKYKQNELSEALLLFLESLQIMQNQMDDSEETLTRANLHMNIGRIYRIYSNYDEALKFYEQGVAIARKYRHDEAEIKFIYNQGVAYKHSGELASAAEKFIESKFLALQNKNNLWYFNSINQLGLINHDLERYDSARTYFDEAYTITDKLKKGI